MAPSLVCELFVLSHEAGGVESEEGSPLASSMLQLVDIGPAIVTHIAGSDGVEPTRDITIL